MCFQKQSRAAYITPAGGGSLVIPQCFSCVVYCITCSALRLC